MYFDNTVRQKLGMILEKLKLEKNIFYKKWSPELIFLNDFFLKNSVYF